MDIKKGATLCSNPFNLKSNTMKNTVQRYGFSRYLQRKYRKKYLFYTFYTNMTFFLIF